MHSKYAHTPVEMKNTLSVKREALETSDAASTEPVRVFFNTDSRNVDKKSSVKLKIKVWTIKKTSITI